MQVLGYGLALAGVVIEQDAAYWETHIQIPGEGDASSEVMFGIATKKDRQFYKNAEEEGKEKDSIESNQMLFTFCSHPSYSVLNV